MIRQPCPNPERRVGLIGCVESSERHAMLEVIRHLTGGDNPIRRVEGEVAELVIESAGKRRVMEEDPHEARPCRGRVGRVNPLPEPVVGRADSMKRQTVGE